jgi:hypothetical protein
MSSAGQQALPGRARGSEKRLRCNGLQRAADALGWDGIVVEAMKLLGQRITVVAALDHHVHAARHATGWGPVTDRMTLALWEEWPDQYPTSPPSPVRLVGFLARGRRWQQALAAAGGFVGFGSTAILLERDRMPTQLCTMTADFYGIAVVRYTERGDELDLELVQEGRCGPVPTARPTIISRWVEELVYHELLDRGVIGGSTTV